MHGTAPNPEPVVPDDPSQPTPVSSDFARQLRGFGPLGILAILVILFGNTPYIPLSALLVLGWAWLSKTPWAEIGFARPKSWSITILGGTLFGATFKSLMKIIVMPLLGADPVNHAYHYLAGNRAALPGAIYTLIVMAGFREETVFRGYMFERFGKLFGSSIGAKVLTILITSAWFGFAHYSTQGLAGTEQAAIVGLVFGTIFAITGRLWMLIVAHAAFDLTALAMIYWNVECRLAHLVFK
jgi:membrane protease YdiL (CAAX protease family)